LAAIAERQELIEDKKSALTPLAIFPEGTTTDGNHLMTFKKGAFATMRPVQPCYVRIDNLESKLVSPATSSLPMIALLTLVLSSFETYNVRLTLLPPIQPNEYMLKKFRKSDDQEEWSIYADCVRSIIAK
jgi:lysophosphatidylcholine acyltransferase/lyso-PAF acetyltransferase